MSRISILVGAFGLAFLGVAAPAMAATTTFTPTADAHVVRNSATNYGGSTSLVTDGSPRTEGLLRFEATGLTGAVSSAKVRLFVSEPSANGPKIFLTAGGWTELGVTWANRPAKIGGALADVALAPVSTWIEYDVTSTVTRDGTWNFLLSSTSSDALSVHSRQGGQPPQLVVTTATVTEPPPPPPPEPTPEPTPEPPPPPPPSGSTSVLDVTLSPRVGVSGSQRVNFAVPLAPGQLWDPGLVRVLSGGVELPAARRELALHPDNSIRSVQVQVQTTVSAGMVLQVRIGETPTTADLTLATVASTLDPTDGSQGPRVWVALPASWLAASGVAGPQVTEASVSGTPLDAWDNVCDYANHDVDDFLALSSDKASWLFDRGTAMYRGYARRGDLATLASAYRETAIYRNGITGTDSATRIGVPGAADDLKYHYTQNMAIHYLMTGDDRFRESAEDVAVRASDLWSDPAYAGGSDFWTERHAGFALLAYTWAMIVSDNEAASFRALADDAVDAYLAMQATYPTTWTSTTARCFAHTAAAHGESFGTWGCSPWMSAILADGLDAYATERGGTQATAARASLVKLGRIIAEGGRDSTGRPYYWMGVGTAADVIDDYDEHWGESAYIVAMAWHHGGRTDSALRTAADQLLAGLASQGSSPHLRSFTWQCRSAVGAAWFLH